MQSLQLELMLLLPALHGVQQTGYDMDDEASMALLGIVQYLHLLSVQLQEADATVADVSQVDSEECSSLTLLVIASIFDKSLVDNF